MTLYNHTFKYEKPPGLRKLPDPENKIPFYPLIPVEFYYNGKTLNFEALLDSGADKILLNKEMIDYFGLPLKGEENANGAYSSSTTILSEIGIRIGRHPRFSDLGLVDVAVCKEEQDSPILMGRTPLFDKFQVIFEQFENKFHLYPKKSKISYTNDSQTTKEKSSKIIAREKLAKKKRNK
ncbi:MAG: retropepsin-like aspartic protease [Promethearchaeota archaeon]